MIFPNGPPVVFGPERAHRLVRAAGRALVLLVAIAPLAAAPTAAQGWKPAKNVELIIPGGVGGGQDRTARIIQKIMQDGLVPTTVTILNKPGGGGNIAYIYLNQFPGDGHYLATATATLLTNHILGVSPLNYTHFTAVSVLYGEYIGFATQADGPFRTGNDLVARVKSAPESVTFAFGTSRGNANHIGVALAMKAAGVDVSKIKVVIYKASIEATSALMGGHVDVVATPMSTYLPVLDSGRIRLIAVAAPRRVTGKFADVPTWKEQGYDAVMPSYRMFIAAKGLSAQQLRYWDAVFGKLAKSDEWKKELAANEWQGSYLNSADSLQYLGMRHAEYRKILAELKLAK
ncbi:MAG: tripartite tricarboxylate transporter substrate binding protein [Betaproteobacteria bacterium]|nr:tripartite tricarboxylate transporter substrate binding protein [Betaproteobacteria bacterium]